MQEVKLWQESATNDFPEMPKSSECAGVEELWGEAVKAALCLGKYAFWGGRSAR